VGRGGQDGGKLSGARYTHILRPWRKSEPPHNTLDTTVSGRPPPKWAKNLESFVILNPMEASAESAGTWHKEPPSTGPRKEDLQWEA